MCGVGKLGMRKRLRVKHRDAFFPLPLPPFLFKLCSLDSERSNAAEELHECMGGRGLWSISGCL